jgi:hypothetical protein
MAKGNDGNYLQHSIEAFYCFVKLAKASADGKPSENIHCTRGGGANLQPPKGVRASCVGFLRWLSRCWSHCSEFSRQSKRWT